MATARDIAATDVVTAAGNGAVSDVARRMRDEHVGSVVAAVADWHPGRTADRRPPDGGNDPSDRFDWPAVRPDWPSNRFDDSPHRQPTREGGRRSTPT